MALGRGECGATGRRMSLSRAGEEEVSVVLGRRRWMSRAGEEEVSVARWGRGDECGVLGRRGGECDAPGRRWMWRAWERSLSRAREGG